MRAFFLIFPLLIAASGFANDEDLQEATPLKLEPPKVAEEKKPDSDSEKWKYRAYAFLEARAKYTRLTNALESSAPYAEFDATLNYDANDNWKLFADFFAFYSSYTATGTTVLNQLGTRYHLSPSWVFAVGKERNRRAPAMFVSPSDFLHSIPILAGPREVRNGEWIARFSHQTEDQSTDLMYVPFRANTTEGFPNENFRGEGIVRHFHKLWDLDIGLSAGYLDGQGKAGLSVQGFVAKVWKVYGELGYHTTPVTQALLGVSYQGSDVVNAGAEVLYLSGAFAGGIPLPADTYGILNLGFPEVKDRFNFFLTGIRGFNTSIMVFMARAEWLINDRNVLGTSFQRMPNEDWQQSLDWKWSF